MNNDHPSNNNVNSGADGGPRPECLLFFLASTVGGKCIFVQIFLNFKDIKSLKCEQNLPKWFDVQRFIVDRFLSGDEWNQRSKCLPYKFYHFIYHRNPQVTVHVFYM